MHSSPPPVPGQPDAAGPPQGPYGTLNPYGGAPVSPPGPSDGPGAPGSPGRRRFTGSAGALIAAGLAALLVVAGGTWYALGRDGGRGSGPASGASSRPPAEKVTGPGSTAPDAEEKARVNAARKQGDAKLLWLRKNDVDLPGSGADMVGPWVVDGTVVTATYRTVTAHSLTDGTLKWSLPLGTEVCRGTQNASDDGKVVLALSEHPGKRGDDCRQMQMVDLRTGKAGWRQKIAEGGLFDMFTDYSMVIVGNTVTAGRFAHSTAYRLSDGEPIPGFGDGQKSCKPYAYAAGTKLIAAVNCPHADPAKEREEVHEVDPATGKSRWSFPLKAGYKVAHVFSVDPLVVSVFNTRLGKRGVVALTDKGTKRSVLIGNGNEGYLDACGERAADEKMLQGCQVVADARTLYFATERPGTKQGNAIVAFDLDTGRPKWRSAAPGTHLMTPVRLSADGLLVRIEQTRGQAGALALIPPGGGAPKVLVQQPLASRDAEVRLGWPRAFYENGRFVLVATAVLTGADDEEKTLETMMAFGE
ncbi:PQQ-binding-like beta-propeller repeat protein [Streptomyces sp. NPDC059169]|uniref:outer membrane protein assembly factor BamB family protein n=1 Tax=unclassified Streptomyces TaxID=2593676 RepID=UPI0036A115B2